MNYQIIIIGTADNTKQMCQLLIETDVKMDLIISIQTTVLQNNHISGYSDIVDFANKIGIAIFLVSRYKLDDIETNTFFKNKTFDLGICVSWQRLSPKTILDQFNFGIFGMHGSSGFLPFDKGRSPMNWSFI